MSSDAMPESIPANSALPARPLYVRLFGDPNAIWIRELRQSARLGRTPWILFALTLSIALLMCSIGGIAAADHASPASLGGGLFQAYFSIAFFVVTVVGPAVAANTIASEREGRTWEAVLLTGLKPKDIARGKFMAAYTTIALYIVVLAPVGALSFLFGGVTATEVLLAYVFLFLIAGLGVAFGLAVSSVMSSLRGAIVVTLILAICIGPALYGLFGFASSFAAHKVWDEIPEAFPVWLPLAYTRASFGWQYVAVLIALPAVLLTVPAWFLYASTVSNLGTDSDDRSTGLKLWCFFASPLIAACLTVPALLAVDRDARMGWTIAGAAGFTLHGLFCIMLFAAEPIAASRRVQIGWQRSGAGAFRRFFGPGLIRTSLLVTVLIFFGTLAIGAVGAAALVFGRAVPRVETHLLQIFSFCAYMALFLVFVAGLSAWIRARGNTPWGTRLMTGGLIFLIAAGPWVVAAIGGAMSHSHNREWLVVASPSPFYAITMVSWLDRASTHSVPVIEFGFAAAMLWGVLGFVMLALAARRAGKSIRAHEAAVEAAEAALREEEAAQLGAQDEPRAEAATDAQGEPA